MYGGIVLHLQTSSERASERGGIRQVLSAALPLICCRQWATKTDWSQTKFRRHL